MVFSGKSVSLVALLEELLFSLGCNVSEMLGKIYLRLNYYFRGRKFCKGKIWSRNYDWGWI